MYRFLLNKRYFNLLMMLGKNKNIHQISRDINMTTSHLTNVTDQWQRENLIKKTKNGREILIDLTDKGNDLIKILLKYDELSNKKQNLYNEQIIDPELNSMEDKNDKKI